MNTLRTHYTPSQCGMFAATLATLTRAKANIRRHAGARGEVEAGIPASTLTIRGAATLLGVHPETVTVAKRIRRDGAPEVIAAVERGDLTPSGVAP